MECKEPAVPAIEISVCVFILSVFLSGELTLKESFASTAGCLTMTTRRAIIATKLTMKPNK